MAPEMVIKMPYKLIGGVFRRGAAHVHGASGLVKTFAGVPT
jgi:hypothetical protein